MPPIYNPDDRECSVLDCDASAYRKGLCYEHWNEAQEQRADYQREQRLIESRSKE